MKLSIITINLNNLEGLKKTMQSVFEQTFMDYEYIIIDGGSVDGSKEFIEQHADKLAYWVSEKDGGIFNAMNKGIKKATGEYLLFLNSGDYLISEDSIENLIRFSDDKDLIFGDIVFEKENVRFDYKFPDKLTFGYLITNSNSLGHAATLIRKILLNRLGGYSEKYRIVSDWELFLLAVNKYNCSYRHVSEIISVYNFEGVSSKEDNKIIIKEERNAVLKEYFPTFLEDYSKLKCLQEEVSSIKKMYGYRIHKKVQSLLKRYFL